MISQVSRPLNYFHHSLLFHTNSDAWTDPKTDTGDWCRGAISRPNDIGRVQTAVKSGQIDSNAQSRRVTGIGGTKVKNASHGIKAMGPQFTSCFEVSAGSTD